MTMNIDADATVSAGDVAKRANIGALIAEYEKKKEALPGLLQAAKDALEAVKFGCAVQGKYAYVNVPLFTLTKQEVEKALRESAWRAAFDLLHGEMLLSADQRAQFETGLADPPEFNMANIRATFGDAVANPRESVLRGLAEAFSRLDKAFKSHEAVKIGVKGLPKRVIVRNVLGRWGTGYGAGYIWDAVKSLCVVSGEPVPREADILFQLQKAPYGKAVKLMNAQPGENADPKQILDLSVKVFLNGNGHLIFGPESLRLANQALAEWYGEVLPDAWDRPAKPARNAKDLIKNLQFYPTPPEIADRILHDEYLPHGARVLDPSAGEGALLDAARRKWPNVKTFGIEVHPGRVKAAWEKGHMVAQDDFLSDTRLDVQRFDLVLMNPPFSGMHWLRHIRKAWGLVDEGGMLISILPASAVIDHMEELAKAVDRPEGRVRYADLPIGAFRESGTNINTVVVKVTKYSRG